MVHLEATPKQGRLEQRLAPLGVNVQGKDYFSASALLQALDRGEIDYCGGGGTPSEFAQAADLLFTRIARDKYTNPGGEAILVANDSPLQTLGDLKGARVAVEEGSTAHYVLIRALAIAGMTPRDVEIVFQSRTEALAQFQAGRLQA
jgi:sulfonate transport system substrate-binding protein